MPFDIKNIFVIELHQIVLTCKEDGNMFNIGDKVVYPMHGAGVITKIEERTVNEKTVEYLVVKMMVSNLTIMIPKDNVDMVGLRPVGKKSSLNLVEKVLQCKEFLPEPVMNWNKRSNMYLEKLKTSNLESIADVVQTLMNKEKNKKISTGERRILNTGKQILLSELSIICKCEYKDMLEWLEEKTT